MKDIDKIIDDHLKSMDFNKKDATPTEKALFWRMRDAMKEVHNQAVRGCAESARTTDPRNFIKVKKSTILKNIIE